MSRELWVTWREHLADRSHTGRVYGWQEARDQHFKKDFRLSIAYIASIYMTKVSLCKTRYIGQNLYLAEIDVVMHSHAREVPPFVPL